MLKPYGFFWLILMCTSALPGCGRFGYRSYPSNNNQPANNANGGASNPAPPGAAIGGGCSGGPECATGVCAIGICQAATCTDGVKNGNEMDIDCGGDCSACNYTWYERDASSTPEYIAAIAVDSTYVYICGKTDETPYGQSGAGFIEKIRKSDKMVMWTYAQPKSTEESGLHNLILGPLDASGVATVVYASGYRRWGWNQQVVKLDAATGTELWKADHPEGASWQTNRGDAIDIGGGFMYVSDDPGPNDSNAFWNIAKKDMNGTTLVTRATDPSATYDFVFDLKVIGSSVLAMGAVNWGAKWRVEKLSANDLSLQASVEPLSADTNVSDYPMPRSTIVDSTQTYFYIFGVAGTTIDSQHLYIEKRLVSDLSLVWSYSSAASDIGLNGTMAPYYTSVNPMIINGQLYVYTSYNAASALKMRLYRIDLNSGADAVAPIDVAISGYSCMGVLDPTDGAFYMAGSSDAIRTRGAIFKLTPPN